MSFKVTKNFFFGNMIKNTDNMSFQIKIMLIPSQNNDILYLILAWRFEMC